MYGNIHLQDVRGKPRGAGEAIASPLQSVYDRAYSRVVRDPVNAKTQDYS